MRNSLTSLFFAGALFVPAVAVLSPPPAIAQEIITPAQIPQIPLKVNQGINFNLPPGLLAYRAWVDDASLIEIDPARPFQDGTGVLYLVARRHGSTQLTLVTRDQQGVEDLYVFRLIAGDQGGSVLQVSANPTTSREANAAPSSRRNPALEVRAGVRLAIQYGLLSRNSELHRAILVALGSIENGLSLEQAAVGAGLTLNTLEELTELGQTAAALSSTPPRQTGQMLPVPPPQSPTNTTVPAPIPTTPEVVATANDAEVAALKERVTALENQVENLGDAQETVMARLDSLDGQQDEFLAQLNSLDRQQDLFADVLASFNQTAHRTPKETAIPASERSSFSLTLTTETTEESVNVAVTPSAVTVMDNHQLANALARGLLNNEAVPYRGQTYRRYQTVIRSLRNGSSLDDAARHGRIQLADVQTILERVGVSPEVAGIER